MKASFLDSSDHTFVYCTILDTLKPSINEMMSLHQSRKASDKTIRFLAVCLYAKLCIGLPYWLKIAMVTKEGHVFRIQ